VVGPAVKELTDHSSQQKGGNSFSVQYSSSQGKKKRSSKEALPDRGQDTPGRRGSSFPLMKISVRSKNNPIPGEEESVPPPDLSANNRMTRQGEQKKLFSPPSAYEKKKRETHERFVHVEEERETPWKTSLLNFHCGYN